MAGEASPGSPAAHLQGILAGKLVADKVIDPSGKPIGNVELLVISGSGNVTHALISCGGILGFGKRFHLVRWAALTPDLPLGGLVLSLEQSPLERLSALAPEEVEVFRASCGAQRPSPCTGLLYGPPFP